MILKFKVSKIIDNPINHRERVNEFEELFSKNLSFEDFYKYIYTLVKKFVMFLYNKYEKFSD